MLIAMCRVFISFLSYFLSLHKKELLELRGINIRKSIRNLIMAHGSLLLRASLTPASLKAVLADRMTSSLSFSAWFVDTSLSESHQDGQEIEGRSRTRIMHSRPTRAFGGNLCVLDIKQEERPETDPDERFFFAKFLARWSKKSNRVPPTSFSLDRFVLPITRTSQQPREENSREKFYSPIDN